MESSHVLNDFNSLPPDAQKQVLDFMAFLKMRYTSAPRKKAKRISITNEPFVGMWKDREDMRDSAKWVRELRQREWGNK